MTWDLSEHDARLLGDNGPWVHHLATAWRACAGLSIGSVPEANPTSQPGSGETDSLEKLIAYWAPLFQLAFFGLGWTRVDLGLSRWLQAGRPTDDPVLGVIERWWGAEVVDVLGWASQTQTLQDLGQRLAKKGPYLRFDDSPFRSDAGAGEDDPSGAWSGGSDPLHIGTHLWTPLSSGVDSDAIGNGLGFQEGSLDSVTSYRRSEEQAVVVADTYSGWYSELWRLGADRTKGGRSVRTDVFVKPIGWLGEYRRSTVTGSYFSGRHRYHVLGA